MALIAYNNEEGDDVMKELLVSTLEMYKREVEQEIVLMSRLEDNPLSFFQALTFQSIKVLALLEKRDTAYLKEFQDWLYPKLIEAMKGRFQLDEFEVGYYPNMSMSPIYLMSNERVVVYIHPYDGVFEYAVSDQLVESYTHREELLKRIQKTEEDLLMKETLESNPILLGKGHPIKTTKILLQQKKAKESIKNEALIDLDELSSMRQQYENTHSDITKEENRLTQQTIIIDRLARRMQEQLQLRIVNPMIEMRDDYETFVAHQLPQWRYNYRQTLHQEWKIPMDEQ